VPVVLQYAVCHSRVQNAVHYRALVRPGASGTRRCRYLANAGPEMLRARQLPARHVHINIPAPAHNLCPPARPCPPVSSVCHIAPRAARLKNRCRRRAITASATSLLSPLPSARVGTRGLYLMLRDADDSERPAAFCRNRRSSTGRCRRLANALKAIMSAFRHVLMLYT